MSNEALPRAPQDTGVHNNTVDPSYRVPSTVARNPNGLPSESSPSVSHPQAYSPSINNNSNSYYSPTLVSPAVTSSYVLPPSPTPSHHRQAFPVQHGYNHSYPTATKGTSPQQQQHQYLYQDSNQQSYQQQQQPYPEPIVHAYPVPALVDTTDERPTKPAVKTSTSTPNNSNARRRKRIIWIGIIITIISIGVAIGLVVTFKNKDNDLATGEGGRVIAPPLPSPMPEKNKCPSFFCHNYYFETCKGACKKDSVYKACKNECNGEFFCEMDCEKGECFDDCSKNLRTCDGVCWAR
ncbi:hypothetical protein BGX24_000555 [Mortierella sp. AD032]|nr:hypothetical protein BGX24_000555 [Mortierella sp. AD032]